MQPYQVRHLGSGDCFYVLAASPAEAIERVVLQIADTEGTAAWTARPSTPPSRIAKGTVVDSEGKPIKRLMV